MADDAHKVFTEEDRRMGRVILDIMQMLRYHTLRAPRLLRALADDLDRLDKEDPCQCERCTNFRQAEKATTN